MASVGRNIVFPIKNADGSSFHNLVLRKATVDSVVMSLGDKITGDVYYKDNTLQCTMQEYVEYKNNPDDPNENPIKYTIVNPPTIVREGLVKDNSDLKGMTKYSFEFYHPMYILGNIPFCDVAVSFDEERYLSQNKTFSWIGKPQDYINKINKNLEGTEWIVVKSDRFPREKNDELSNVLSFDNNTIADALKTGYETWGLPYVVSQINIGEPYYSQGKRFKVEFGLPSNEILVDNEPYIFQFGQGVGLKNNSRTPRNNKIITRIAGYGSENNIPYGYPQIRWYGDQSATQTPAGYPIYDGIVGGVVRKLIKHPFTRTHLMPSVYSQTVFNKVSPYLANGSANPDYNPNEEIIDYYDAVYSQEYQYINEINLLAPSYEIHGFDDIKPELDSDRQLGIVSAIPLNQDLTPASQWDDTYDAEKDEYVQSYFKITLPQLSFDLYACASIMEEMQVNMRSGACIGCTFPIQVDWEDYKRNFYDADGNFLPDGSQRDLTKYPKSNLGQIDIIVQKETQTFGTLMPNIYQQPTANNLFVILGISMPVEYITNAEERLDDAMKSYMLENNVYYYDYPLKFDEYFLATHTNILAQIRPNSIIRFGFKGYPTHLELFVKQITVKYGDDVLPQYDITLTDNIEIVLNQIGQVANDVEKLGSLVAILRQTYNRNIWSELDKKLSKVKDDSTPYKLGMGEMQVDGDANVDGNLSVGGDTSSDNFQEGLIGGTGWSIWKDALGITTAEFDKLNVRMKAVFAELEVKKYTYSGGNIIYSDAGNKILLVLPMDASGQVITGSGSAVAYRCCWLATDGEFDVKNEWAIGDQARCQTNNFTENTHQYTANRYYWRKVLYKGEKWEYPLGSGKYYNFIDLAADVSGTYRSIEFTKGCQTGVSNDVPAEGDSLVQMGYQGTDSSALQRQNLIILVVNGDDAPAIKKYQEVNDYSLDNKMVQGDYYDPTTHTFKSITYGEMYVGDKGNNPSNYMHYSPTGGLEISGVVNVKAGSSVNISALPQDVQNAYGLASQANGRAAAAQSTANDAQSTANDAQTAAGNAQDAADAAQQTANENTEAISQLSTGSNLLLNSGFRGQFDSRYLTGDDELTEGVEMWSPSLEGWQYTNAVVSDDVQSYTTKSCKLTNGTLVQTLLFPIASGTDLIFSVKAKGTSISIAIGGYTETQALTNSYDTYKFRFKPISAATTFTISGTADICELFLEEGNVLPATWEPSPYDNPAALAKYESLRYLSQAIHQGSTTVLGGLILSNLIELGNYVNQQMQEVTAGMSGIYNDGDDVAFWGGGTLAQAIAAVNLFKANPHVRPSDEVWDALAHAVITHGGRAILNDVILRGDIYAENGEFRGKVEAMEGSMSNMTLSDFLKFSSTPPYRMRPESSQTAAWLNFERNDQNENHKAFRIGYETTAVAGVYTPTIIVGDYDDNAFGNKETRINADEFEIRSGNDTVDINKSGMMMIKGGTSAYISLGFHTKTVDGQTVVYPKLIGVDSQGNTIFEFPNS